MIRAIPDVAPIRAAAGRAQIDLRSFRPHGTLLLLLTALSLHPPARAQTPPTGTPAAVEATRPIASFPSPDDQSRIEVLSLKRGDSGLITLNLKIRGPAGPSPINPVTLKLIDLPNRQWYGPGMHSPYCDVGPDPKVCWAVFKAPPAGTRTLALQFDGSPPLEGIPVSD